MPSSNGLTPGTDDYDMMEMLSIPDTSLDDSDQKRVARLSKTRAWKQISEYLDNRVSIYSEYRPGVNPAVTGTNADWLVADCIIREFQLLQEYVDTIANGAA